MGQTIYFHLKDIEFSWDSDKDAANRKKHGLPLVVGAYAYIDPYAMPIEDQQAGRGAFLGYEIESGVVFVAHVEVFDPDKFRIISVRKATPEERRRYGHGRFEPKGRERRQRSPGLSFLDVFYRHHPPRQPYYMTRHGSLPGLMGKGQEKMWALERSLLKPTIGARLRAARRVLKITREELAQRSGISLQSLLALESDQARVIGRRVLLKLAKGLGGVQPLWILSGRDWKTR